MAEPFVLKLATGPDRFNKSREGYEALEELDDEAFINSHIDDVDEREFVKDDPTAGTLVCEEHDFWIDGVSGAFKCPECAEEDDDPQCACGVHLSEHALCGCPEGFQTRESWGKERAGIYERAMRDDYEYSRQDEYDDQWR